MAKSFTKNPGATDSGVNIKGIVRNQRIEATRADNSNRFGTRVKPKMSKHQREKNPTWKRGDYGDE